MLVNVGRVGRLGGLSKKQSGYSLSWTYAGGATVASPTTIWSENTSDANNQITVKYNGVIAYLEKKIAGASTWCTVSVPSLSAGTYPVVITLNSDNTIKLKVNSVESGVGLSNELYADTGFDNAGSWTLATATVAGSKLNFTAAASGASAKQTIATTGKCYLASFVIDSTTGSLGINTTLSGYLGAFKNTAGTITGSGIALATTIGIRTTQTLTAVVDTASAKEIYNNTSTTAIPWATVL